MTRKSPRDVADDALGQLVERLSTSHHRRRLAHVGWTTTIDPPPGGWAEGGASPRPGNALTVLIDGADALQAMAMAIAEARSHVHVTGWHITPNFALTRGEQPIVLKELLAQYPHLTVERALQELRARGFPGQYTIVRQRIRLLRPRAAPAHALHDGA